MINVLLHLSYKSHLKPFPFSIPTLTHTHARTHGADNATSCGAFLCDVGLVASGHRMSVRGRQRRRQQRGKETAA